MPMSKERREQINKWDSENMAYQTIKVRKSLLDAFKAACAERGDKVNTVLREAMERYVRSTDLDEQKEIELKTKFLYSRAIWGGLFYAEPARQEESRKALDYLCRHVDYAITLTADFEAIQNAEDEAMKKVHNVEDLLEDESKHKKVFGAYWKLLDELQDKVIAHMKDEEAKQ